MPGMDVIFDNDDFPILFLFAAYIQNGLNIISAAISVHHEIHLKRSLLAFI